MYSLLQRLRSLRHRFWYGVSEGIRWSRGEFRETPAHELPSLTFEQAERITALRERYQVQFERHLSAATSLKNYEYLELLDLAAAQACLRPPIGGVVCDIGCASFWYAAALQAFFRPSSLVGVEVEGHRLFKDGRARLDYATGYLADMPNARFVVADYRQFDERADVITAWFPFVTANAILAWRLPLSLLQPEELMARIYHNLIDGGLFIMANHGHEEATKAHDLCAAVGFELICASEGGAALGRRRSRPAVVSFWR